MNGLDYYLKFCRRFHNFNFPKIKFKELNDEYIFIYKKEYNIYEEDINKASFIIFLLSSIIIILISMLFSFFNVFIIIFYSVVISLIISYRFNINLYKKIKKKELEINALLFLIMINLSLLRKTLKGNTDYTLVLINIIKEYNLPIVENIKKILAKIHEGDTPEEKLSEIITPSEDFNKYLRNLLINNFYGDFQWDYLNQTTSEKNFRIILRDIESKISIVFFIGLFFPIGLCFLILFQQINIILAIFFIPFFLILLHLLFRKLIKIDIFLLGFLKEYSIIENRKFEEFLLILKTFALNLRNSTSPEKALIDAYLENKKYFKIIDKLIDFNILNLINLTASFSEMLENLKYNLNSYRYSIILNTINNLLRENSLNSSEKILEILDIIYKQRRLEEKLNIIIKGERFKVIFFIFLLPLIIGAIGGLLPMLIFMTHNMENFENFNYKNVIDLINILDLIIIFTTLFLSNLITCYYFLKIIHFEKRILIFVISSFLFVLIFFMSFINSLIFI